MADDKDIIKCRDIRFSYDLPDADHAEKARQLLVDVPGIETLVIIQPNCLRVRYDVRKLTLQMLENALIEVGFALDNSFTTRLVRGICAYCEDAHRSSLHVEEAGQAHSSAEDSDKITHDPRPDNWRNYL